MLLTACASIGSPKGGPKDVKPPLLISSEPAEYALNYSKKRVEILFSELISLVSPSEKVLVTPPQIISPVVKAVGNKAVVILADTLKPNTTYTIDFTDAIVDYNEGNKFGDYAFSFSTGSHIDSLRISGVLIDAANLNPLGGILVGTYTDFSDSAFFTKPFDRISKSSTEGKFSVKGLPKGQFLVRALGDKNRDYKFQPNELLAFLDSTVTPYAELCYKQDTVWKDSTTVDSVIVRSVTCFKPDNLVLQCFTQDFGRQYLAKRERAPRNKINLNFGFKAENLPKIELLGVSDQNWYLLEKNKTKDTLVYWIIDSTVLAMDTLHLKVEYQMSDSLNNLVWTTDTLNFISRTFHPKAKAPDTDEKKKKKEKDEEPVRVQHLAVRRTLGGVADIYSKPMFEFSEPIESVTGVPWHLYIKKDSLWKTCPFTFSKDSLALRSYILDAKWTFGAEYKFVLDSGKVRSFYNLTNDSISSTFKVRDEDEYSRLTVLVQGLPGHGFVELLNGSDRVVRMLPLVDEVVDFKYLAPGRYYLRAVDDRNGNNRWDTGDYSKKRQPEQVYYNPKPIDLRENWDVEEVWNVNEFPLLEQKPKELLPKTTQKK